ncbi:PH domain-containing protein [Nakamurella deserti]|uniref:PH domain-containing protein n=1 Tax=Nakamurella deserti TaxID=2164074 RepID=UPI000DBE9A1C|nr:PH domain-containing protein [Nakamurella deserti]
MSDQPHPAAPPATGPTPGAVTVRPRRIAVYAAIGAAAVILVGVFVALKLRGSDTGVYFRTSDAVAMAGLGLLFAGGIMLTARPRLRADAHGLRVRNIVGERFVPWPVIERISFPEGAVWAQLELADDEVMSVMAIQSMDKERAVVALREVRALYDHHAPPQTRRQRTPVPAEDPNRPLGRLEIIDREKAAQGGGRKRRR